MTGRGLDFFALGILIVIAITLVYAIIGIHDIPYNIAKKRNHPHQDAIHTAGWVSLFLMHTIWPFLWIWATMYRPDRGWGMSDVGKQAHEKSAAEESSDFPAGELAEIRERLAALEKKIEQNNGGES